MNKEKNFKKIYEEYVDVRDKKIIELLKENKRLNDLLEGEHEVSQMYLNNIIKAIEYIENKQDLSKMFGNVVLSVDSQKELLDILKGVDEVEIIEEDKKIEKVFHCSTSTSNEEIKFLQENINQLGDKINEIIDYINGGDDKE